jgi:tetratricopeptide (TPR) repeat protein
MARSTRPSRLRESRRYQSAVCTRHPASPPCSTGERNVEDQKAFELTEKARQAYPQDPDIARALGILNYRRQYYPRAAELLQEAARARADDPELQFYLGAAHYQLKQWNQCKAVLDRALSLNPVPKLAEEAKRISAECSEMSPQ